MNPTEPAAILLADLGYGDAGKGAVVDYLARALPVHTVVRYNGGAQAAHNVVAPDGRHHTFAQFGSGTFVPGVRTHLSRVMLFHPAAMLAEERALRQNGIPDAFPRTTIERGALVITPYQQAANRLRELARGGNRHGSCGMGVGETQSDYLAFGDEVLFAGDLADRRAVRRKLAFLREAKLDQLASILPDLPASPAAEREVALLRDPASVEVAAELYGYFAGQAEIVGPEHLGRLLGQPVVTVFEGAQGVLLDERWGFYPYNSWSTLTFRNADSLLAEAGFPGAAYRLGLLRAYATRHGAGPFVTEDDRLSTSVQDYHNQDNPWQHEFRVGYLDLVALRYALTACGGVDGLGVTCLDRLAELPVWQICNAYQDPAPDAADFFAVRDGLLRDIRLPADPTDLAAQEALTRRLMGVRPVYEPPAPDQAAYLAQIEAGLGSKIALTSAGPDAGHKAIHDPTLAGLHTAVSFYPSFMDKSSPTHYYF